MKKMRKRGFTLVELLIVIAIIGILASLVLPRIFGPQEQSRSTEARHMLGVIRQLEEAYRNGPKGRYLDMGGIPPPCSGPDWAQLGMGDPNLNSNNYFDYCVSAPSPDQFLAQATRKGTNFPEWMCLNNNGTWSGNYLHTPENPRAYECGTGTNPELCCP